MSSNPASMVKESKGIAMNKFLIAMMTLALVGCQAPNKTDDDGLAGDFEIILPKSDIGKPSEQLLAEAAATVSRSISQLAQMQRAKHPDLYKPLAQQPLTQKTAKLATVKWTGPVEPLLRKLAEKAGMTFSVMGQKTAMPVIVTIDVKQTSVADIIKNVSYQSQNHASVNVDTEKNVIELRYLHS